MVHQHFRLVPTLSVEENIVLGLDEGTGPFVNFRKTREKISSIANEYGLSVDLQTKVWQLTVGQQQRVEILKALYREVDILIMDEPTSVLTPQEVDQLFSTLRTLVDDGLTIIFITHKLDEVMRVSDRVTVLRGESRIDSSYRRDGQTCFGQVNGRPRGHLPAGEESVETKRKNP
jgi:simple sugar transport system ATP-binding protein